MSRARARQAVVLLAWSAVAIAAVGALHAAGRGALAPPALTSPSSWPEWLEGRDPIVAAFAAGRVLALAAAGYVAAVTVAGVAARLVSARRLASAVDRVTLPVLRRLVVATVSVGLGTGGLAPALAAEGPPLATVTTTTVTVAGGDQVPPSTITMRRLPPADGGAAPVVPATPPGEEGAGAPAAVARTWTVTPGQCLWSIAEAVLAGDLGRPPVAREVVPYWERLIEANRRVLADPANPDLVFPGQVFNVPAP